MTQHATDPTPAGDRAAGAPVDADALAAAASLFHGFSDPSRLAILTHLALGEHRVVDLVRHLGLAQSTVSQHLACLRDCGLVEVRTQGRASMHRLSHPEALLGVLESAERLLGLTGSAVALCPRYGVATTAQVRP
ncbi:ArsR/SmtB family transcription factor [Cellulomonas carbonis]|nr:metalloregulator ArsR/SmtB family transcription factor [Cellulomonas carbonis]